MTFRCSLRACLGSMNVPRGVALNAAIYENIFMILTCVMTRTPLVIVGKPGTR
jgi:hypothetical protein